MIHTGLIEPIGDLKSRVEASLEKKFCLCTAAFAQAQIPDCPVDFAYLTSPHSHISQCLAINLLIHLPLTGAVSLVEPWYRLHRILLYGYLIIYLTNPPQLDIVLGGLAVNLALPLLFQARIALPSLLFPEWFQNSGDWWWEEPTQILRRRS